MPFHIRPSAFINGPNHLVFPRPSRIPLPTRLLCAHTSQFHTSPRHDEAASHYETLGLAPGAPQAEVKKQYYKLSKSTHPDRNPNDPTAATRFSAVSDAYATLGNPDKRARYDRDVMRTRDPAPQQRSGPAGGRSGSGLSSRKSPFRGPPKSFYASGGYGSFGAKRAAEAETTAQNARKRAGETYTGDAYTSASGGFSPGQQGPHRGYDNDVPHFDRDGHYRTQETVQGRMRRRVREEDIDYDGRGGFGGWSAFLVITIVVWAGLAVPALFFGGSNESSKEKDRKNGS